MYAELHCRSNFSFLQAASHPDELVAQAAVQKYSAIAITDIDSIAGVVRGHGTAKELGIGYIVGAEIHPRDCPPMVLWPSDRAAYGRLCRLLSRGRMRAEKGECDLGWADVVEHAEGMLAGMIPDPPSPVRKPNATIPPSSKRSPDSNPTTHPGRSAGAAKAPHRSDRRQSDSRYWAPDAPMSKFLRTRFRETCADRGYLLAHLNRGVDDRGHARLLGRTSLANDVPLLAAGDVRYHTPDRAAMLDLLTAIRHGVTIDKVHQHRPANATHHLRSTRELKHLYRDIPVAMRNTEAVAERCRFSLDDLRYEYPEEIAPPGLSLIEHLRRLTWEGARQRWPRGVPDAIITMLRHEMAIIRDMRYEAYFLTVWDMVRFARSRGILCQGRGSAANSAVCYCLGVTSVDPSQTELLFERFISRERNEAPDIDIDFEHQRREEVLQYLYDKYGRDRAGMTAVVTTYRIKSAIREVGKALAVSPDVLDTISKLGGADDGYDFADRCRHGGLEPTTPTGKLFVDLVETITGFPRHLSQHTGGMVMTAGRLCELCVIENASMADRTVIQWNKDDLDELGILKVDVLALGMLSAIRRCFELVEKHHGRILTLASIPPDDEPTYDMIGQADTMGVFQIESRAQMNMLPQLKPRCYYDLVVEVAIVRPGPIQGDMVHPYLKGRQNPDAIEYPNDAVREVLEKTHGVPIFQEQAMRLAVVAAGFTPGEADQLRRAMAAWRRRGIIEGFRHKLLAGMHANGLSGRFAEQVFHQIRGFGEYGFPESHAASFALLVYASCYLKCHYPAAFCAGLLNSQPMGFYAPAQLVDCARRHGVDVLPIDVTHSDWDCTLVGTDRVEPSLRLGLRMIRGLAEHIGRRIESVRHGGGRYRDVDDLSRRCRLGGSVLSMLADAGALESISGDRRAAIWDALDRDDDVGTRPLLDSVRVDHSPPDSLVPLSDAEQVQSDFATTGLSLRAHPISFVRERLDELRCVRATDLPDLRSGRHVRVAGLVLLRQRPETAKGVTFVTVEDETGAMNLVVFPKTWKRFYGVARTSNTWLIDAKLEIRQGIVHLIVGRIENLSAAVGDEDLVTVKSRDFH